MTKKTKKQNQMDGDIMMRRAMFIADKAAMELSNFFEEIEIEGKFRKKGDSDITEETIVQRTLALFIIACFMNQNHLKDEELPKTLTHVKRMVRQIIYPVGIRQ